MSAGIPGGGVTPGERGGAVPGDPLGRAPAAPAGGVLPFTGLGPVAIEARIASGKVTTVYRARLADRVVALKVFRPRSVRRHASRHETGIAEFEFRRNSALWSTPGLRRYVAEPIAYLETPGISAVVQELLDGELYYHVSRRRGGRLERVFDHLARLVELAHAAGLYDLDLHALNVMVVREGEEEIPRLFDFNRIPFHERPRNPFEALALRLGILDRGSRDRRKLRQFHRFERLEHRLAPGFGD